MDIELSYNNTIRIEEENMAPVGKGENEVKIMEAQGTGGSDKIVMAPPSKASRSHSEAERKRRQRINGHLATLRTLLPSASRVLSLSLSLSDILTKVE